MKQLNYVSIYADGADIGQMRRMGVNSTKVGVPPVTGFTTNPSLMRASGVSDYREFATKVLEVAEGRPVCLEVVADDYDGMVNEARELAKWGKNVVVKIPVVNTAGEFMGPAISCLTWENIPINVTAIMSMAQVRMALRAIQAGKGAVILSLFCGRIADAGRDPAALMKEARQLVNADDMYLYSNNHEENGHPKRRIRLLWASVRQVYDVIAADRAEADIITLTPPFIEKLPGLGRDLTEFSIETVRMFRRDAQEAGLRILP